MPVPTLVRPVGSSTGFLSRQRQALSNLKTILTEAGSSMQHVTKTTVYLTSMNDFQAMNKVYGEVTSTGARALLSRVRPDPALVERPRACAHRCSKATRPHGTAPQRPGASRRRPNDSSGTDVGG